MDNLNTHGYKMSLLQRNTSIVLLMRNVTIETLNKHFSTSQATGDLRLTLKDMKVSHQSVYFNFLTTLT